ncbi:MAG TPA: TadE/TadG family type IV pilus assembly protein [Dongiaceae bacterium]|jgi:Flp pilus assembly protein TadG
MSLFRFIRRLRRSQRGVAAVEFALIAPAFFGLIMSVIDVGRYMWVLNTMQYAIDDAVRAGVVQKLSNTQIKQHAADALKPISASTVTVAVVSDVNSVTVTATSSYHFFFPISSFVETATIDLRTEMPL